VDVDAVVGAVVVAVPLREEEDEDVGGGVSCSGVGVAVAVVVVEVRRSLFDWATEVTVGGRGRVVDVDFGDGDVKEGGGGAEE
jgi:hypothetical protein